MGDVFPDVSCQVSLNLYTFPSVCDFCDRSIRISVSPLREKPPPAVTLLLPPDSGPKNLDLGDAEEDVRGGDSREVGDSTRDGGDKKGVSSSPLK